MSDVEKASSDAIADLKSKLRKETKRRREAEEKADSLQHLLDHDNLGWSTPRTDDDDGGLPVPRLELRWSVTDRVATCWYMLVHKHLLDHIVATPLGMTTSRGYSGEPDLSGPDGTRTTPFRDGAHAWHDAKHLGLPLFVTTPDGYAGHIDEDGQRVVRPGAEKTS